MRPLEDRQPPSKYPAFGTIPSKKAIRSPFDVVREYRNSQYSRSARSISGDPDVRSRKIFISLCGTFHFCLISILLQLITLNSDAWGYYVVDGEGVIVNVSESGRFGLWRVCVEVTRDVPVLTDCGGTASERFALPAWSVFAGISGVMCLAFLGVCLVVAIIQLTQIWRRAPPVCYNRRSLSQKIIPVMLAVGCVTGCIIFAALAVKRIRVGNITYGSAFWLQGLTIFFVIAVLICIAVESMWRPYPSNKLPLKESAAQPLQPKEKPRQSFYLKAPEVAEESGFLPQEPVEVVVSQNTPSAATMAYRRSYSAGAAVPLRTTR